MRNRSVKLTGSELLLKTLESVNDEMLHYSSIHNKMLVAFMSATEHLKANPVSDDELAKIVKKVMEKSEGFTALTGFPQWYKDFLKDLPPQIQDAIIVELGSYESLHWFQSATVGYIGGQALIGTKLLWKTLESAIYLDSIPNENVVLKSTLKQLEEHPVLHDELIWIVKKVMNKSEYFKYHGSFPQWYKDFLKCLPPQIQDAIIVELESYESLVWFQEATIRYIDGQHLTGSKLLWKTLISIKDSSLNSILDEEQVALKLGAKQLETIPLTDNELAKIVKFVIQPSEKFKNCNWLPKWYKDFLKVLPPQIQNAIFVGLESIESFHQRRAMMNCIDSQRSVRFFEGKKQKQINIEKLRWASQWNTLSTIVSELHIIQIVEAKVFLQRVIDSTAVVEFLTDSNPDYGPSYNQFEVMDVENVILWAVQHTLQYNLNFAILVRNANLHSKPVHHLRSTCEWDMFDKRGDTIDYGCKIFFIVRIGESNFICHSDESHFESKHSFLKDW